MSLSASGRTWEQASSPAAVRLVQRFEAAWRGSAGRESGHGRGHGRDRDRDLGHDHPDPDDFLPDDTSDCPGARLALLRADLALRWENGERVGADWYLQHYDDLGADTLVALVYEEFCLREEHEDAPEPSEYFERFPEVAAQLRRVFDIHGLVGSASTTAASLSGDAVPAIVFPDAGQTIAGFYLVEELGRGAFARVFLAQERQLADRLVALKVARTGSREPQTLARLQHTHIVPVHSSRTDPATGLHLLWMPYFGRLTLARILADPKVRGARTGGELVEALDRLGPREGPPPGRAAGRAALARRSYAEAIAWWGARMAEALEHAHDRGVLHRDIKPSNVLVTGDGMPMLLDFNLAREPLAALEGAGASPGALGGTLDYMAPEHLEALGDGLAERVDGRGDIYGLGVLLYEALTGSRPFSTPRNATSAADLLRRAAAERRHSPPRLRVSHPEVPAGLEAVVRRCLAPDPDDRYPNAGELAADLQAVADDQPLRHTREPWRARAVRWVRRRRRALAMIALVAAALGALAVQLYLAQVDHLMLGSNFKEQYQHGSAAVLEGDYKRAQDHFKLAADLVEHRSGFVELHRDARNQYNLAKLTGEKRNEADRLFRAAKPLRFRLIGFCGNLESASEELLRVLEPFFVLKNPDWTKLTLLDLLDTKKQRDPLLREVNELLFLWIVALDQASELAPPEKARALIARALGFCDQALVFAQPKAPWVALRARLAAWPDRSPGPPDTRAQIAAETSAQGAFQWGLLRSREGRHDAALAWLRRAAKLEPSSYWYNYYLAYTLDNMSGDAAQADDARAFYTTAVSLDPESPWVRLSRARLYHARRVWGDALADLWQAQESYRKLPAEAKDADFERKIDIELGRIYAALGDIAAARHYFSLIIDSDPASPTGRGARTNLARIDVELGALDRARAAYDALLKEDPDDGAARFARALLSIREGRMGDAEADLTESLKRAGRSSTRAELHAYRAMTRVLLGRAVEAEADAAAARDARPDPAYQRLWTRTLLARGRLEELRLDDPEEVARLPLRGPGLQESLYTAAGQLKSVAGRPTSAGLQALLNRTVILSALGDPVAPLEANRAVDMAPLSVQPYLVRARVLRRARRLDAAREDVERGLALRPEEPRLWELRGQLKADTGDYRGALADFDRANQLGGAHTVRGPRAAALMASGDAEHAAGDWTLALWYDPEDPAAYLGRAQAFLKLGLWDHARADLEQAAAWTDDWGRFGMPIILGYVRCLIARPAQLPRVLALTRRALSAGRNPLPPIGPPS